MKTKFFTLFVALLCVVQIFAYDFEVDGVYYNNHWSYVSVTHSNDENIKYIGSIVIPDSITYNGRTIPVKEIGQYAFSNCTELTSITIGENITMMGYSPFDNCTSLSTVVWNAIEYIDDYANLFEDSPVQAFILGDKVEYISNYLCYGMKITSITIPKSVKTICSSVFSNCSKLDTTFYKGDISSWCKIQFGTRNSYGNLSAWSANPIELSHNLFINGEKITNLTIPDDVTTILPYTFYGLESLKSLTISNSITDIGEFAFGDCTSLTNVLIEEGLDSIARDAFNGCTNLTKFICHSSKAIEEPYAFDEEAATTGCVLENVKIDTIICPASLFDQKESNWLFLAKNIKYIQIIGGELTADAFGVINRSFDKLQTLDISAAINTEIANNAFKGCYKLETLLLPKELETIGYMSFAECVSLKALDIPASVTEIGDRAFEDCRSIETLTFGGQQPASAPQSKVETPFMASPQVAQASALQRIGNWAFYNCHELQHLEIPDGVTEIGAAAFYGCTYLEDLTLPASVQSIGDNCFALCSKLNRITCLATTPPTIEAKTFYDVKRSIPLYVPEASINDYANDTYWGEFINTQAAETPDGVDNILQNSTPTTRKVLHNGTIYILRNGEKHTIDGRKVE